MLLLQRAVIHTECANVCEIHVGRCKFPELIHRFWTDGSVTESTRSPPGEGRRHLVKVMGLGTMYIRVGCLRGLAVAMNSCGVL